MSQAKVDRYKEEKKNRKKTMAKEKRLHLLAVVCGWLVVIALAGWAGVSGYQEADRDDLCECIPHHRLHQFFKYRRIKKNPGVFSAPGCFYAILPFFYVLSAVFCVLLLFFLRAPGCFLRAPGNFPRTLFYSPISAPESSAFASAFSIAFNNTTDVY